MVHPLIRTGVLALFLAAGAAGAQDAVYKWWTTTGSHYSDQPPMGAGGPSVEAMDIRVRRTTTALSRRARSGNLDEAADIRERQKPAKPPTPRPNGNGSCRTPRGCEQAKERASRC